jgi:hypothetical protein
MTEPADLAHAVLLRLADFVRRLPPEQVRALADGTATLRVVGAGGPSGGAGDGDGRDVGAGRDVGDGRGAPVSAKPAAGPRRPAGRSPGVIVPPVDAGTVRAALSGLPDRAAAVRYLDGLGLSAVQLRALAAALGLAVPRGAAKAAVRDTIVQWTVGRRVDGQILGRP